MRKATRRNNGRRIAGLVLAAWLAAGSALAWERTEWKTQQPVRVVQPGVHSLALPPETLDAARGDLGDLRLLDPEGKEVAYLLERDTRPSTRVVPVKSFRSTLGENSTQLVIACGDFPAEEILLESPAREFVKRATIEASDNGSTWRTVREGEPLFRQARAERLAVRDAAPFLRITIDDTRSRPVPFTGARMTARPAAPHTSASLDVRVTRREEFAGETVLTLELAAAHVPLSALELTTPERLFTRRVSVGARELREESAVERTLATGTLYKVALDEDRPAEQSAVPLDFTAPSRELIVHVTNDDSPPLAITGVKVWRYEVRLHFDGRLAGDYTLLSGHPQVAAPRYDVSTLRPGKTTARTALTPGPLAPNPGHRSPEAAAGVTLQGAPLDAAPWHYRKAVRFDGAGVHQLELDLDVLAHAHHGLGDLRLLADGLQVPYLLERPALSRAHELAVTPAADPKRPRFSRWQLKLPRAGLPLTRLTLTSPGNLFQRQLRIYEVVTDDRGNSHERGIAAAEWRRTPGEQSPLVVRIDLPPVTDTLIVETDNGDNPPLALGRVTAAVPVTRLLFKAAQTPLALYYGNPHAAAPRYDLALVAGQIVAAEKQVATLGAEEKARAGGWGRALLARGKGGVLFWGVLGLVVVALLVVVAKLLPKPPIS